MHSSIVIKEITTCEDLTEGVGGVDVFTFPGLKNRDYLLGLATSRRLIDEALRLRYRIFNLEMGEGLRASEASGMDSDRFDRQMDHLVLFDKRSGEIVGTYRLQPAGRALAGEGIYSAQEFDFAELEPVLGQSIELGRACLTREHRRLAAVLHMWQGIACYLLMHNCRYLFGCVSITSCDPDDGWRAMKAIRSRGCLHPRLLLPAKPEYNCGPAFREQAPDLGAPIPLPPLFRAYARIGAKVISEPALDCDFGTVDFLMMLDGLEVRKSTLDVLKF